MASMVAIALSSVSTLESQLLIALCLQYALSFVLPVTYAFLTILTLFLGKLLTAQLSEKSSGPLLKPEDYTKDVKMGRWTAQPGLTEHSVAKKLGQDGVVLFIIGARTHQYFNPLFHLRYS